MSRNTKTNLTGFAKPFDPILEARAERTVANLRKHYERGQKANCERTRFSPRELAQRHRINSHTLRKERRFARCYTEAELEELLGLRRPDGMPFHWGHVIYFITITRKADRKRIQKRAAKEGWSAPKLYSALQEEFANGEGRGGRPVKVPPSAEGRLRMLIEETERWLRRSEAVRGGNCQDWLDVRNEADKESLKELARTLSERLKQVAQVSDKMSEELNGVRQSRSRRA